MKERRRYCRIPHDAPLDLVWTEGGETKSAPGKFIDISVGGFSVESAASIANGTSVSIRADAIDFCGSASVRHVSPAGANFIMGLELSAETSQELFAFSDFETV